MYTAVAIDGPAGAGKSTLSRKLAEMLEFIYVDTGALYRAVGLSIIRNNISYKDLVQLNCHLKSIKVDLTFIGGEQRVLLLEEDVSDQIRTPQVSMMASNCSAQPVVRSFLLDLQRSLSKTNNVVMDGRDIATVVLPDAKIKIFLTASPNERANRRYLELVAKGDNSTYEEVLADLIQRDYNDENREVAPLKPAEDSIIVDTTGIDFDQSLLLLYNIVNEKLQNGEKI